MKKYPTIHYLERICRKCKNSREIYGKRFCGFIMPNFDKYGFCKDYEQAPKKHEEFTPISMFKEELK